MARYIDADALTSKVRHFFCELIDKIEPIMTKDGEAFDLKIVNPLLEANKAIASIIREQPTADVVEVVRCKDCKWYEIAELKSDGTVDKRYKPSVCVLYQKYHEETYFCADGERREDGEIH